MTSAPESDCAGLDASILGAIRAAGALAFEDLAVRLAAPPALLDRRLRHLRAAGAVSYAQHAGWRLATKASDYTANN